MIYYIINFKPSVEKDLKALPKKTVTKIMKKIEELSSNPFPNRVIKLSDTEHLSRVPVGEYTIIYEINNRSKEITIHYVRHRREACRNI